MQSNGIHEYIIETIDKAFNDKGASDYIQL